MFYKTSGLIDLDLSSFDTSNVTDMNYMFYGANNLKTIYVSDSFTTTNLLS
jgi:surface protein